MKRPKLNRIPLRKAIDAITGKTVEHIITMSYDQWDELLDRGYKEGWMLLELDGNEKPLSAYQKSEALNNHSDPFRSDAPQGN